MKKTTILLVLALLLSACESFLDRSPIDKIGSEAYFKTARDLELYVNQFYEHLPSFGDYGAGVYWSDDNSDNMVYEEYNVRLAGYTTVPGNAKDAKWEWDKIRSVNYFIGNYHRSEDAFEENSQYIGEGHFFRAWFYYDLLTKFGDLPWVNTAYDAESPELYNERLPRTVIVDSMLVDLDKAIACLHGKNEVAENRISKEVALLFKSRVALFEGTWEKYHAGTVFAPAQSDPARYFRQAADAAGKLMELNTLSLFTTGDGKTSYYELFNKNDYSKNPEVMLWRKYSLALGLTHRLQGYLLYRGSRRGFTKDFVDDCLFTDGLPRAAHPESSDKTLAGVVKDRDPRLAQMMWVPGDIRVVKGSEISYFDKPFIDQTGEYNCLTGYQLKKGADPYVTDQDNSETGLPLFRYAEALLNYAEAKAELGELTQVDIDKSVNKLRGRVGVAPLTMASITKDPAWKYPEVSPVLNEIRRERRIELACEGFRLTDLLRWKVAERLVNKRPRGFYFNQEEFPELIPGKDIRLDAEGYIDPYKESLSGGYQFNPQRDYLLPLPTSELVLNKKLKQNPGW